MRKLPTRTGSSRRTRSAHAAPARAPPSGTCSFCWAQQASGSASSAARRQVHSTHKNLGLTDADKARLTDELTSGKAAVGVMSPIDTAPTISDQLTELGGEPEAHEPTDEGVQAATAAGASAA